MANKKFIQVGERNSKGRIVKNEQYSVQTFTVGLANRIDQKVLCDKERLSLKNRLAIFLGGKKAYKEEVREITNEVLNQAYYTIHRMIDEDKFGRKKK